MILYVLTSWRDPITYLLCTDGKLENDFTKNGPTQEPIWIGFLVSDVMLLIDVSFLICQNASFRPARFVSEPNSISEEAE
jgi:hypothetical protein